MRRRAILLAVCGAIGAALVWWGLRAMMPAPSGSGRLAAAAIALLPAAFVLAAMVGAQMAGRFVQAAFDPLAGADNRFLRVNQRVITNTVEQIAIFAPALLALAALAPPAAMPSVLALAATFALARLVFWAGYLVGPMMRAPGMAATTTAVAATLLAAAALTLGL